MENLEKQIIYYTTADGKCPYLDWLNTLDSKTQDIVNARIDWLKDGLLGDWKRLTNSKLSELRINFGKAFIRSLEYVVRARGRGTITALAKDLGMDRSNLSEILNHKKTPRIDTIFKLINGLGYDYNIKLQSA